MKVKIKREFLNALLDRASTVGGGTVRSFLLNCELTPEPELIVVRTDSILAAVARTRAIELEGDGDFKVIVSSDKFSQLIKSLSGEEILLDDAGLGVFKVSCGNYEGVWKTEDLSKYPLLPSFKQQETKMTVSAKDFVQAIERVKYAGAQKTFSFSFRQIYFDNGVCWATDGSRYQDVKFETKFPVVIPIVATDVAKFIKLTGIETLDIETDTSNFYFRAGEDLYISRNPMVISIKETPKLYFERQGGTRPGWFVVELAVLREIVRRIGLTSTTGDSRIAFTIKSSEVQISGVDEVGNRSQESMLITFQGDSRAMRKFDIQWDYLLEALSAVRSATADFVVGESHVALKSEDSFGILPMLKERNE